jgi:magnesium chelatase subunit D
MSAGETIWSDAIAAAALFAVDPIGLGGVCVRAGAGPIRDRWLEILRGAFPPSVPFRKLPPAISDDRLIGGVDLAATLQAGRPVAERGLLSDVDGGVLIAVMAERLAAASIAHVNAALDAGEVVVERDGLSRRTPSSFGIVALDEGLEDERLPEALSDRLAFHIDLRALSVRDVAELSPETGAIATARRLLPWPTIDADGIEALCRAAASLGITSLRATLLAVRSARATAALEGDCRVRPEHLALAAALVLAPRARSLPETGEPKAEQSRDRDDDPADSEHPGDAPLDDVVLEAAQAAIPPDLLKRLQQGALRGRRGDGVGRQGLSKMTPTRGRPIGTRRGELRSGARLNVLETLRAAAPWQTMRRRTACDSDEASRVLVRKDDFRLTRFKQKSATSTIFVVDTSGSSALQRLAEVKGAVELLLADCYVRRDQVGLIAFRGTVAELILPPTRSLARAKRSLAALAGGGGTPLAAAIASATTLAGAVRSKGHAPTVVLLTDGRANVSRDGRAGRAAAEADAQQAARALRMANVPAIVIDTSPRPQPQAERIAVEMRARYVALPYADASRLSSAVRMNIQQNAT